MYFELGCELGPSEAQAQNTSKNDDFKNCPLFDLIFMWELILDTYRGLGYAQFGWSIFLNRWWLLKRCVRHVLSIMVNRHEIGTAGQRSYQSFKNLC